MTRDHTDAVMLPLRGVFVVIVAHTLLSLHQRSASYQRRAAKAIFIARSLMLLLAQSGHP